MMRTSIPVEFTMDPKDTLVFSDYNSDEIEIFETKNVTFNAHNFALSDELF